MSEFNEHDGRMRVIESLHRNPLVAVFDCVWPGDVPKYGVLLKDFAIGPDGQSSFVGDVFACDRWMNECKHVKSGKTWSQLKWEHLEKTRRDRFWRKIEQNLAVGFPIPNGHRLDRRPEPEDSDIRDPQRGRDA